MKKKKWYYGKREQQTIGDFLRRIIAEADETTHQFRELKGMRGGAVDWVRSTQEHWAGVAGASRMMLDRLPKAQSGAKSPRG